MQQTLCEIPASHRMSTVCFKPASLSRPVRRQRALCTAAHADQQIAAATSQRGVLSRRSMLQLPSGAMLASLALWLAEPLDSSTPAAAAAAAGPRQLNQAAQAAITAALSRVVTKPKAPVLLRLAYHDAATYSAASGGGGANASIRFELNRPENTGLNRGWRLIGQISDLLKGTPAGSQVSNADLIALAGAHAVAICGGPQIDVAVGRVDAAGPDPEGRMVSEKAGAAALVANFAEKGLSVQELVALSGAHTLGGKGFGDPVTFDNTYYTALLKKPWLNTKDEMAQMIGLPSDHALPEDPDCLKLIEAYAADQQLFFRDFAEAYVKLTNLGAVWA